MGTEAIFTNGAVTPHAAESSEHAKAPGARLARDLAAIGGSIGYDVSQDGRSIMLRVFPRRTLKLWRAQTAEQDTGTITLYDPTR
jgi:hypothetical protein